MLGLPLPIGFDVFCLADLARAAQVRYLPKWAWALICLIQTPGGGIMYLSIGHIGRPRPVPPPTRIHDRAQRAHHNGVAAGPCALAVVARCSSPIRGDVLVREQR
jgi:hypothetical protein